jgi:hypothetical protein
MTRAVAIFAVIQFTIIGLSYIIHHRAWVGFFMQLRGPGYAGVFAHGFLLLGFASMILAFHPVWSGAPWVLTIVGVLYLTKTLQCFLLPDVSLRSLNRVTLERSRALIGVGVLFLAIAGATVVALMTTPFHG